MMEEMGTISLQELLAFVTALAMGFGGLQSNQILFFGAGMIALYIAPLWLFMRLITPR
jgi:hypothetical protein